MAEVEDGAVTLSVQQKKTTVETMRVEFDPYCRGAPKGRIFRNSRCRRCVNHEV